MTTIKLNTSDQILISAKKVKIAAGDINSVLLHVTFDDAWADFMNRKAIFSNDSVNGGATKEALLVGDECIVPHEVLASEGILSISVTGYTEDGTTKKTSGVAKQKITYSLKDATTTIAPTMDLYMQYLAALNEKMNPVTENINAQLAANLAAVNAAIAEQMEWMKGDVLWENENPTETMESLTVPIDRTQYPRLHVLTKESTGINRFVDCVCVHENGTYRFLYGDSDARNFIVTDESVIFKADKNDERNLIPVKIIGYKY